jgi:hypothetical protein
MEDHNPLDITLLTPLVQCRMYQYQWILIGIACAIHSIETTITGELKIMRQTLLEITQTPVPVLASIADKLDTLRITAHNDTKLM